MKPEIIPEILFLKQEDVIKAGLLDMSQILKETENTFKAQGNGKVIQPPKVKLGMPDEEHWESYANSMPAYIDGDDEEVCGFKWASEAVHNPEMQGVPYGIDVVILSDPKTMFPKAILDGTITTAMRTSATAGVFAKYCANKDSKTAALIGAGVIGRTMIEAMMEAVPALETVYLADLDASKAQSLAAEFEGKYVVVPMTDTKDAVKNADIIVTETTSRKPFIKKDWLKSNATCIQMETEAFEHDCVTAADLVVIDSWAQLTLHTGAIKTLYEAGKLTKDDVTELKDIVAGHSVGRASEDQFVCCKTLGMGMVDIAIANKLFHNAEKKGLGTKLTLWDEPLWV